MIFSFLIVAALAACSDERGEAGASGDSVGAEATAKASPTDGASTEATASASDDSIEGAALDVEVETETYQFEYSWPESAGSIPELESLLQQRMRRSRSELERSAAEGQDDARDNGFPFNKYSFTGEWEVVASLPDWLSLSFGMSSYMGGAHGIYGEDALVWNKQEEKALDTIDLFESASALEEAVQESFCAQLDQEREKRRGEPVEGDDMFGACPSIEDLTVFVGSSNGRTFDRLTLYAGPYVAGPYAEGDYEIHLPATAAVLAAVKPEYRESFSARN